MTNEQRSALLAKEGIKNAEVNRKGLPSNPSGSPFSAYYGSIWKVDFELYEGLESKWGGGHTYKRTDFAFCLFISEHETLPNFFDMQDLVLTRAVETFVKYKAKRMEGHKNQRSKND